MLKKSLLFVSSLFFLTIFSCSSQKKDEQRIVIWTNNSEIVQYIELFNKTHSTKAVLVYKENPSSALEYENENFPDIVIAPYLKNHETRSNFDSLNYLFDRKYLIQKDFYSGLLKYGEILGNYYLLPVSFNLPTVIFSSDHAKFVKNDYTISTQDLFKIGQEYNKRNSKNKLTQIGFSPLSSDKFLYFYTRINGAQFKESKKNLFSYNQKNLESIIENLVKMTVSGLNSVEEANDFVYKYLSVVDTKRVTGGRTLFAYTTSDNFFNLPSEQISKIDFRWVEQNGLIPVEDSIVLMGISKNASNYSGSLEFISWFYNTETQRQFLELKNKLASDLIKFGITGGFSSVKEVNEQILPLYYKSLLSNFPQEGSLKIPEAKPVKWEEIKESVIIPYIKEKILASEVQKQKDSDKIEIKMNPVRTIEERITQVNFTELF